MITLWCESFDDVDFASLTSRSRAFRGTSLTLKFELALALS